MSDHRATRTQVSKAHPAVKAVLDAAFGAWGFSTKPGLNWTGRTVVVVEADEQWSHTVYADEATYASAVRLGQVDGGRAYGVVSAQAFERPRMFDVDGVTYTTQTVSGGVLVLWSKVQGKGMVEVVVPASGRRSFDQDALAVAVDVVLASTTQGAKKKTTSKVSRALAAAVDAVLEPTCGPVTGLASAVVEARAKLLRVKQETSNTLVEATSLEQLDLALNRLRRVSVAEYTQLVQERGGLMKLADAVCRSGRQRQADEDNQTEEGTTC